MRVERALGSAPALFAWPARPHLCWVFCVSFCSVSRLRVSAVLWSRCAWDVGMGCAGLCGFGDLCCCVFAFVCVCVCDESFKGMGVVGRGVWRRTGGPGHDVRELHHPDPRQHPRPRRRSRGGQRSAPGGEAAAGPRKGRRGRTPRPAAMWRGACGRRTPTTSRHSPSLTRCCCGAGGAARR